MPTEEKDTKERDISIRKGKTAVFGTRILRASVNYNNVVYLSNEKKYGLLLPSPTSITNDFVIGEKWGRFPIQNEESLKTKEKFTEKIREVLEKKLGEINKSNLIFEAYVDQDENLFGGNFTTTYSENLNKYVDEVMKSDPLTRYIDNRYAETKKQKYFACNHPLLKGSYTDSATYYALNLKESMIDYIIPKDKFYELRKIIQSDSTLKTAFKDYLNIDSNWKEIELSGAINIERRIAIPSLLDTFDLEERFK